MVEEKWNDIWKIMKDNQFEFDNKFNSDILCIICMKVLINAQFGPCGCRFCLDCITNYLNGEEKHCPGNTDDCKEETIKIKENIYTDQQINIKISKCIVKCPEKNCEFKDKLRNIEDHIRICESRSAECPYLKIGCKESHLAKTNVKNHMLAEIVSHTKMLFELIDNLKNEIIILKDYKAELIKELEDLKKCIDELKVNHEMGKETRNRFFDGKKCNNDSELKFVDEDTEIKNKIKEMENKFIDQQKNVVELIKEIKKLRDETDSIRKVTMDNKKGTSAKINKINQMIFGLKSTSNKSSKLSNKTNVSKKHDDQANCTDFDWIIDKWNEKTEQARAGMITKIYSEGFYSHKNGYKICLSVNPDGSPAFKGIYLSINFYLMVGEFDDILLWPFKYNITFQLINQQTSQIHTAYTIKYDSGSKAYQRPINKMVCIAYNSKFILLKELLINRSLIHNDRILIKCSIAKVD